MALVKYKSTLHFIDNAKDNKDIKKRSTYKFSISSPLWYYSCCCFLPRDIYKVVLLLSASAEAVLISSWACISIWPMRCSRCLKSVDWETSPSRNCELLSSLVLFLSSAMPISTWLIPNSSSKLCFVRTFSMVCMIFLYWGLCIRRIRECTSE